MSAERFLTFAGVLTILVLTAFATSGCTAEQKTALVEARIHSTSPDKHGVVCYTSVNHLSCVKVTTP